MVAELYKPRSDQIANMRDLCAERARTHADLAEAGGPSGKKGIKEGTYGNKTSPTTEPK